MTDLFYGEELFGEINGGKSLFFYLREIATTNGCYWLVEITGEFSIFQLSAH
jgi:hypothetical protein